MGESLDPLGPLSSGRSRRAPRRRLRLGWMVAAGGAAVVAAVLIFTLTGGGSQPTARARAIRHARRAAHSPSALLSVERILGYTSYIARGSRHRDDVALTFDDGPSPYTPEILAILRRTHVRATFFEIGANIAAYPRIAAQVHRDGMLIGDHTQTHPPLATLSAAAQTGQLRACAREIESIGAPFPVLWRPPYGSFNATTLSVTHDLHMLMVLWSVDTSDYARPGAARIEYTALSGARGGTILLFHDGGGNRSCSRSVRQRIIEFTALTRPAAKQAARMFRWCVDQLRPPVKATTRLADGSLARRCPARRDLVSRGAPDVRVDPALRS